MVSGANASSYVNASLVGDGTSTFMTKTSSGNIVLHFGTFSYPDDDATALLHLSGIGGIYIDNNVYLRLYWNKATGGGGGVTTTGNYILSAVRVK